MQMWYLEWCFLDFFLFVSPRCLHPSLSIALWPSPSATLIIAVNGKIHIETDCLTSETRGLLYRHSFEASVINHVHINWSKYVKAIKRMDTARQKVGKNWMQVLNLTATNIDTITIAMWIVSQWVVNLQISWTGSLPMLQSCIMSMRVR